MKTGIIVEYIDRQRILCAVVWEVKKQRLRLLTENNREVSLSPSRLLPGCGVYIDLSLGRNSTVDTLKIVARQRHVLIDQIDSKELGEVLNTEEEWIDLETMTGLCFPDSATPDHQSAVVRAFFNNRLYFRFNQDHFFPNSKAEVEKIVARGKALERRKRLIEKSSAWLKSLAAPDGAEAVQISADDQSRVVDILKSYYLFGQESPQASLARPILKSTGIDPESGLFGLLVNLEVFDPDENIALLRYETPVDFPKTVVESTARMIDIPPVVHGSGLREDLSHLRLMTIDGQATLDFDDALSIERQGSDYLMGIHISDVGALIPRGSDIDEEALTRGSSIYMPDMRIPMLPSVLTEGRCSLIAGKCRPAISTLVRIRNSGEICGYRIVPSYISVQSNYSYYEVNQTVDENEDLAVMYRTAKKFRATRLSNGAVQITLPEVHMWLNDGGEVVVSRVNRESPARMMVAELMIMANWIAAEFLAEKRLPAIFRSQPDPKERLIKGDTEGTLFQNCMQRRRLNRFILRNSAERHSGLGLKAYVTATSPIRKYFDLATQRQIRAGLGFEEPYSVDEIDHLIQVLEIPMWQVSRIQIERNRYWLLKYLETRIGEKEEALVLYRKRNGYQILLTQYMLECGLPISGGIELKPENMISVTLQHVSARKDTISVFVG